MGRSTTRRTLITAGRTASPTGRATVASECSPATVTLTVSPVNDAPVAVDDSYEADAQTRRCPSTRPGVLAERQRCGPGRLDRRCWSPEVTNGTLSLDADGSFDYTPDPDFSGLDSFTYRASDGVAGQQATVSINVGAASDGEPGQLPDR